MFDHLELILQDLRPCFSRQAAFQRYGILAEHVSRNTVVPTHRVLRLLPSKCL